MSEKAYCCLWNSRTRSVVILEFTGKKEHPWYENSKIEALERFIRETLDMLYQAQDRLDRELFIESMNQLDQLHEPEKKETKV